VSRRGELHNTGGLRRILRALARRPILVLLAVVAAVELIRFLDTRQPVDVAVLALLLAVGVVIALDSDEAAIAEGARQTEAESFARILRGLSRSVSPEAIVDAIVEELGAGTEADHVSVVRRRPESRHLEAVLSPTRPGAPASRTYLPLSELEDPLLEAAGAEVSILAARGRRFAAVPIEPDADGDPGLVSLGLARSRPVFAGMDAPVAVGAARGQLEARGLWDVRDIRDSRGAREELGAASSGGSALLDPWPIEPARRRPSPGHASPMRVGAEQRIADRIAERLRGEYGLRNLVAAPLRVDGRVEGAIVLSRRTNTPWTPRARRLLAAAAIEASAALSRLYTLREAQLRATTDALTGLPNRRYFDEYLGLLARRRRAEDRVGVLMIDIDRFKKLNDTYGHAVGDHVLREVAQAIATAVREGDVPARFGGEEFVVLLRNPGPRIAVEVGERVRRAVADLDLRRLGVAGSSRRPTARCTGPSAPVATASSLPRVPRWRRRASASARPVSLWHDARLPCGRDTHWPCPLAASLRVC
jgi:diguanylate cyclase (GGDEF)-like protein